MDTIIIVQLHRNSISSVLNLVLVQLHFQGKFKLNLYSSTAVLVDLVMWCCTGAQYLRWMPSTVGVGRHKYTTHLVLAANLGTCKSRKIQETIGKSKKQKYRQNYAQSAGFMWEISFKGTGTVHDVGCGRTKFSTGTVRQYSSTMQKAENSKKHPYQFIFNWSHVQAPSS